MKWLVFLWPVGTLLANGCVLQAEKATLLSDELHEKDLGLSFPVEGL